MTANAIPDVQIGSVILSIRSRWQFTQEYTDLYAETSRRAANGSLYIRRAWGTKLRTQISGSGKLPLALASLSTGGTHTIKCAAPRHVGSNSNVIDIPIGFRTGGIYTPIGWAIVDNQLLATTLTMDSNTATLAAVSGADGYQVAYFPEFVGHISELSETLDNDGTSHTYSWRVTIEEV